MSDRALAGGVVEGRLAPTVLGPVTLTHPGSFTLRKVQFLCSVGGRKTFNLCVHRFPLAPRLLCKDAKGER